LTTVYINDGQGLTIFYIDENFLIFRNFYSLRLLFTDCSWFAAPYQQQNRDRCPTYTYGICISFRTHHQSISSSYANVLKTIRWFL